MSTLTDLKRAWLISSLGLTPPQVQSEAGLEAMLYASGRAAIGSEIAYAENVTGTPTTVPVYAAAHTSIPGCLITVPANTRPVEVAGKASFNVGTSGGGLLVLSLFDVTAGGAGTELERNYRPVVAAQITSYSGNSTVRVEKRLGPSASDRLIQLKVLLFRDGGSGLTATVRNAVAAEFNPSTIMATQR